MEYMIRRWMVTHFENECLRPGDFEQDLEDVARCPCPILLHPFLAARNWHIINGIYVRTFTGITYGKKSAPAHGDAYSMS
jgi:hypothetical protein